MSDRPNLESAANAPDILEALARAIWAKANDSAECPTHRLPTSDGLTTWLPECPEKTMTEAGTLLAAVAAARAVPPDPAPRHWEWRAGPTARGPVLIAWGGDKLDSPYGYSMSLEEAHGWWRDLPPPRRPRHPLAPLIDAWQRMTPWLVQADRRSRAILPASLRGARRDPETLPLTLDRVTPLGPIREPEQGYLPGLEPPPSVVPPVPWLPLYDLTGSGPVQTRGRGAPLAQRLFVEVLTAVHVGDRDPEWITAPPITLRDLFEWCWPRYWDLDKWNKRAHRMGDWSGGYQRNKHLMPLCYALVELDNMRIEYDRYQRRLIRVDDLPTATTALDDPIQFHVRHLPGSDRGPMIERAPTRRWGVVSAAAWRSTIRLAYLWDEAKRRNHGARVYATRPKVARGLGGVILGDDGKPLRNHHGAVVTDWSDRRAVVLGANRKPAGGGNPPAYERNPAADRVPVLGPDDLIRLAFDDNLSVNRPKRLLLAREALRAKEAAKEVTIETDGKGWRIIEAHPTR